MTEFQKIAIVLAAVLLNTVCAFGSEATFSKDNSHLYLVQWKQIPPRASGECSLIDINLEKKTCSAINFIKKTKEHVSDLTLSNDGHLLCATKAAIWSYDPVKGGCNKLIEAPKDVAIEEIAYDPTQSILFAICYRGNDQTLYCLPQGRHRWLPVYNRRPSDMDYPVFGADGSLYFVTTGDLWAGFINREADTTVPALNHYSIPFSPDHWPESIGVAELAAYRFAPVASLETQNITSDSTGLHDLAVSKHFIYGDYARMGGTGWGALIRCPRATIFTMDKDGYRKLQMPEWNGKQAIPVLQSIETISDGACSYLSASSDGSLVFFTQYHQPFLIRDDAKPEKLAIEGLNDLL